MPFCTISKDVYFHQLIKESTMTDLEKAAASQMANIQKRTGKSLEGTVWPIYYQGHGTMCGW